MRGVSSLPDQPSHSTVNIIMIIMIIRTAHQHNKHKHQGQPAIPNFDNEVLSCKCFVHQTPKCSLSLRTSPTIQLSNVHTITCCRKIDIRSPVSNPGRPPSDTRAVPSPTAQLVMQCKGCIRLYWSATEATPLSSPSCQIRRHRRWSWRPGCCHSIPYGTVRRLEASDQQLPEPWPLPGTPVQEC